MNRIYTTCGRFYKINREKSVAFSLSLFVHLDSALLENENSGSFHGNKKTIFDGNSHLDNKIRVKKRQTEKQSDIVNYKHIETHAPVTIIPV